MKNLKRVLSLGLALVMLLGMMIVAGAADMTTADLTDMADVQNVNAVSLLVDLGIINGIEQADGTYKYVPEGNIDRSSWAKMVYYVLEGNNSADPYKGTVTDLKDISGWWAEGYIAFLKTAGIVAGDDRGMFNIKANIRVDEAAKMLLCVAGWDADDRGYVGDSWSGSIMRDARKFGLTAGIDQAANAYLTRDNAALMIYNAMNLATQSAKYGRDNGVKYVTEYIPEGMTLGFKTFGIQKVNAIVASLDENGNAKFRDGSVTVNGCVLPTNALKSVNGAIPADASIVGQSVEFFVTGEFTCDDTTGAVTAVSNKALSIVSSGLCAGGADLLETVTGGVTFADKAWADADDDDNYIVDGNENVWYCVNGGALTQDVPADQTAGNVTEFYDTDADGAADLVRVYNYTVGYLTGDVTVTTKNDTTTTTVPGVGTTTATVKGAEGLVAGDVVLYYNVAGNKNNGIVIEKAETVDVTPTDIDSSNKLIAGGTKYTQSPLSGTAPEPVAVDFAEWPSEAYDIVWTFYLDKAGLVCAATTEVETVSTDYVIVLAAADVAGTGGLNGTAGYTEAQILHLDGTDEVVKVVALDEDDVTAEDLTVHALYEASVDSSNNYSLTATTTTAVEDAEISAALKFSSKNETEARNSTKFIVGKGTDDDGYTYTTYDGYKNLPSMDKANGFILVDSGVAKYVYLLTESFSGEGDDGMYYLCDESFSSNRANSSYVMNVVNPEGEEATLEVSLAAKNALVEMGAGKFFTIGKTNEIGVATAVEAVEDTDFEALTAWSDGAMTLESGSREYDDATVVIIYDVEDGAYSSVSISSGSSFSVDTDAYTYVANVSPASGTVDTVYVIRTVVEAEEEE